MKFEPVTLVPYEPKLMDMNLMTVRQLEWLNSYNQEIVDKVLPKINDERTQKWIQERVQYIDPALSYEVQKYL